MRHTVGRVPPVDYWAVVHDWDGNLVYEGPAPVPPELVTLPPAEIAAGHFYHFDMTPVGEVPTGLVIQLAPTHWRFDRPHHPRRCLLCWVERLAVATGFARYEEDPNVTVTVETPPTGEP